jgi:hypothetical protein
MSQATLMGQAIPKTTIELQRRLAVEAGVRYAGLFSHPHSPNLVGEWKSWVALEPARGDQVSHCPRGVEDELEHGALYGRNGGAGIVGRRNLATGEDGRVHEGHRRCSTGTRSSTWEPRRVLREDLLISRWEQDMLRASRYQQRCCSQDLSPGISQLSNKYYGERPVLNGLQYGCGMARPDCSVALHVLPGNPNKIESRRADSNRSPLLQLRVCLQAF